MPYPLESNWGRTVTNNSLLLKLILHEVECRKKGEKVGLAQRRIVEEYQPSFEKWKDKLDKVCGFKVPIEVRWETMQDEGRSDREQYFSWYEAVYFRPLMEVFTNLCSDKMGKDAVKKSVKKIVIDGTEGASYKASSFEDGQFTIRHKFFSNVDNVQERVDGWSKLLLSKL